MTPTLTESFARFAALAKGKVTIRNLNYRKGE
jgi:hypothetical protein